MTLFDDSTTAQATAAGQRAMQAAADGAELGWCRQARELILSYPAGHKFMPDEVVKALRQRGIVTPNTKTIGPMIQGLAREGFIQRTAELRAVRTSHGSRRPVWIRLEKKA